MQKKLMLAAVAVMMLAACNGAKQTHVSAQFGDNAPARVKVTVGDKADTVVVVKDGKFEVDVPVDVTTLSRVRVGMSVYSFISDGSKITLDPNNGKAYSDKKNGIHTRYTTNGRGTSRPNTPGESLRSVTIRRRSTPASRRCCPSTTTI